MENISHRIAEFLDYCDELAPPVGRKECKLQRFDLIPPEVEWELAELYGKGCEKYADRNWELGYPWGWSLQALRRHLNKWQRGESIDPESGIHHLIAVIWHAICLYIFEKRGLGTDDIRTTRRGV